MKWFACVSMVMLLVGLAGCGESQGADTSGYRPNASGSYYSGAQQQQDKPKVFMSENDEALMGGLIGLVVAVIAITLYVVNRTMNKNSFSYKYHKARKEMTSEYMISQAKARANKMAGLGEQSSQIVADAVNSQSRASPVVGAGKQASQLMKGVAKVKPEDIGMRKF